LEHLAPIFLEKLFRVLLSRFGYFLAGVNKTLANIAIATTIIGNKLDGYLIIATTPIMANTATMAY
jgi:hypothetical protein